MSIPTTERVIDGEALGTEGLSAFGEERVGFVGRMPRWRSVLGTLSTASVLTAMIVVLARPAAVRPGPFNPIPGMNMSAQLDLWGAACGKPFDQCGGHDFHGNSCCQVGCACKPSGHYFSSCQPIQGQGQCNKAMAERHAHDVLEKSKPLQDAAIKAIKAKAEAAKAASIAFARASVALTLAATLATEEAEAIRGIDTRGDQLDYVHSVATAGGAAYRQDKKGKIAWAAGDAAHKAEEHRIKMATHADDACKKLRKSSNSIAMWLGAATGDMV